MTPDDRRAELERRAERMRDVLRGIRATATNLPPRGGLGEARERLAKIAREAAEGLGPDGTARAPKATNPTALADFLRHVRDTYDLDPEDDAEAAELVAALTAEPKEITHG